MISAIQSGNKNLWLSQEKYSVKFKFFTLSQHFFTSDSLWTCLPSLCLANSKDWEHCTPFYAAWRLVCSSEGRHATCLAPRQSEHSALNLALSKSLILPKEVENQIIFLLTCRQADIPH